MKPPVINRITDAAKELLRQANNNEISLYDEIDDAIYTIEDTLGVYERNLAKELPEAIKGTYTSKCEAELSFFLKKNKDKMLDACKVLSAKKTSVEDVNKCVTNDDTFRKYVEIVCNAQNDHITLMHTFSDYAKMDKRSAKDGFYAPYMYSMDVVETEFSYLPIAVYALFLYVKQNDK